jgi:hypothetical protein
LPATQLITLPLAFALSACLFAENKPQENVRPTDYKSEILDMVRGSLEDPTNIRDASIAEPALKPVAGATRYVICLRYNPKDGGGQYMGIRTVAAVYFAGHLTQIINATPDQCGGVAYQPFSELQKLCRAVNCQT